MSTGGGEAKVDFRVDYQPWPAGKEFPLTPLEAWYVMRDYAMRPARRVSLEEFLELPRQLDLSDRDILPRQT